MPPGRYQLVALGTGPRVEVGRVDVPVRGYAAVGHADLATVRGVRTKGGLVDVHPWSFAAGYGLASGLTAGTGHAGWLSGRTATGRGHAVVVGASLRSTAFHRGVVQGLDTEIGGWLGWELDLLRGPARLGPSASLGAGRLRQQVARAPDPVWGAWYGAASAEQEATAATLRAHAGLAGSVPVVGGFGLVGSLGAGPSVAWGNRAGVDVQAQIGLEVAP